MAKRPRYYAQAQPRAVPLGEASARNILPPRLQFEKAPRSLGFKTAAAASHTKSSGDGFEKAFCPRVQEFSRIIRIVSSYAPG